MLDDAVEPGAIGLRISRAARVRRVQAASATPAEVLERGREVSALSGAALPRTRLDSAA